MTNIAILVPVCSRGKSYRDISEIPFLNYLYPSFERIKENYNYTFFIGYDDDDIFYIKNAHKLKHKTIKLSNCQHAPAHAWNKLAEIAYKDEIKYDYFFQIGDDVILQTKNWTTRFINKLKEHNNIGVVGPCNLANYNLRKKKRLKIVIENSFVSRKHLDIFGYFFHPEIKNWYCDDWITEVYKPFFSQMQIDILCKNSINTRYKIEHCKKRLPFYVKQGIIKIYKFRQSK
jgi:hypothetical protein